jgi:hypothetical protein
VALERGGIALRRGVEQVEQPCHPCDHRNQMKFVQPADPNSGSGKRQSNARFLFSVKALKPSAKLPSAA